MRAGLFFAAGLLAFSAQGQAASGDDPRILSVSYSQGALVHVATSPQTMQTVMFAPGERIQSVIVSDPNAYQISVAGSGDSFSFKSTDESALAIISVRTDQRSYELELTPASNASVPSVIRFSYGAPPPAVPLMAISRAQVAGYSWRTDGSWALRPARIRDDGGRTYIEWRREQAMPAVFSIGAGGVEQMVDGYVRGEVYTIDRVHSQLIFRIDKQKATATRAVEKRRNG